MNYCIVENGIIVNIIVCDNDDVASLFGALSGYEGAGIGTEYNPPEPDPEPIPDPEEPEEPLSVWDELDAAYQEGVNGAYDE